MNLDEAVRWLAFARACYSELAQESTHMIHGNYSNELLDKWLTLFQATADPLQYVDPIIAETKTWLDYVKRYEAAGLGNQLQASEAYRSKDKPIPPRLDVPDPDACQQAGVNVNAPGAPTYGDRLEDAWKVAEELHKRFLDDESFWIVCVEGKFAQIDETKKITLVDRFNAEMQIMDMDVAILVSQLLIPDYQNVRAIRIMKFSISVGKLVVERFTYPESTTKRDKAWEASEGVQIAPCAKAILGNGAPYVWDGVTASDSASHVVADLMKAGQMDVIMRPMFDDRIVFCQVPEAAPTAASDKPKKRGPGRPKKQKPQPMPEPASNGGTPPPTPAAAAPRPTASSGAMENGATWSLSDETKRAAFLQRAVKEKLMEEEETHRPDAWELLHERAPSGWMAQGPFGYDKPTENWGALVDQLQKFGLKVTLQDIASLSAFRRSVIQSWVESKPTSTRDLPTDLEKFLPIEPAAASAILEDAWARAEAMHEEFSRLET
jgi:hypothetical protein